MKGFGKIGSAVIAGGTAAVMVAAFSLTASQAAWTDNEYDHANLGALDCVDGTAFDTTAWGKFVSAFLAGTDVAPLADFQALTVDSGSPTSTRSGAAGTYEGDDAWVSAVDLSALSSLNVALSLPLFESGDLGAYTQYGQAHQAGQSTGASGLLTTAGGGVTLGSADADPPGVGSFDLSSALDEVIGESDVIEPDQLADLGMSIGAVSSLTRLDACAALWAGADPADFADMAPYLQRQYLISSLSMDFGSSLVSDVTDQVVTLVGSLEEDLDELIDDDGLTGALLTNVTNLVNGALDDLDDALGILSPFGGGVVDTATIDVDFDAQPVLDLLNDEYSSDDGTVTVNLGDSTITADIAALAGGLNNKDPNSSLLTPTVLAGISTGVGQALANFVVDYLTPALEQLLLDATVTVDIGSTVNILTEQVTLSTTLSGSLGQFVGLSPGTPVVDTEVTADGAILGLLNTLLPGILDGLLDSITGAATDSIDTVLGTLVPQIGTTLLQPLIDDAGAADALVDALLTEVTGTLIPGLLDDLLPVFDLLGDIVQLSVNVQPDQAGDVPFPSAPGPAAAGRWFESALRLGLLDLGQDPLVALYLGSSSAGPNGLTP